MRTKISVDSAAFIAVDLTPLLPDGEAGGAGVLAIDLVKRIRRLAPQYRLLLLTSSWNHDQLGDLFDSDVQRLQIIPGGSPSIRKASVLARQIVSAARSAALDVLLKTIANVFVQGSRWLMARAGRSRDSLQSLRERGVDLLFCPFTAPTYAEPGLRTVSILYDLQHLEYPQFFAPQEVANRNSHLGWLRRWSDVVVCISEHSRQTLVCQTSYPSERTRVVPIAIHDRFRRGSDAEVAAVRAQLHLYRDYVLYPANGWPHKNHRLLLAAFGLMCARNPNLDIDLVFTGAKIGDGDELATAARRMGLQSRTHWVGYRTADELAAIYQGCRMVVFPSLYEGFGIPLLEAMWFGKPVACSNTTSLPEVGGDAVRYFDPRRPEDIAVAMEEVLSDRALAADLATRGHKRLEAFNGEAMALAYLNIFEKLLGQRPTPTDSVAGVFADGWTGAVVRLAHAGGDKRTLELELEAPGWLPHPAVEVSLNGGSRRRGSQWQVLSGQRETLRIPLPSAPGYLSLEFHPLFRPSEHGISSDARPLGCLCRSIHVAGLDGRGPNLLAAGGAES